MDTVIGNVFSAIIGFVGGLLVPWVKWEIEKRRNRYEYRKDLIAAWKRDVEKTDFTSPEGISSFCSSPVYSSLRSHMEKELITKIEAIRSMYVGGGRGHDVRKHMLLDEIAKIEKKWIL